LKIFLKPVDNIPEHPALEKTLIGVTNYGIGTRYERRRTKRDMSLR
jgi:hypothetical protein